MDLEINTVCKGIFWQQIYNQFILSNNRLYFNLKVLRVVVDASYCDVVLLYQLVFDWLSFKNTFSGSAEHEISQ